MKQNTNVMGVQAKCVALFICYLLVCQNKIEGNKRTFSKEEHIEIERQLKLLNKPARKSIVTGCGDVYDCVDFHKQPAFDSHALNNHDVQVCDLSRKTITISQHRKTGKPVEIGLKDEGCPLGTVPLKRVTKNDLIKANLASDIRPNPDPNAIVPGIPHFAIVRTVIGNDKSTGAGACLSIHNPKVSGRQYSAARLKLGNGPNSIEAGWRVDPTLYGGNQTRFYIRTDVGRTHCFNTLCRGFVVVNHRIPLDFIFETISKPGEDPYDIRVFIIRDKNGHWYLQVGEEKAFAGYWPASLFSNVSFSVASYIEWGGEAYGPVGTFSPPMGSGNYVIDDTQYDAFVRQVTQFDKNGRANDAKNVKGYRNADYYVVSDEGYTDKDYKHLVLYGGPGGKQ